MRRIRRLTNTANIAQTQLNCNLYSFTTPKHPSSLNLLDIAQVWLRREKVVIVVDIDIAV